MENKSRAIEELASGKDICIVFKRHSQYFFAPRLFPDLPSKAFDKRDEAIAAAQAYQRSKGRDPQNVIDLTDLSPNELAELGIK